MDHLKTFEAQSNDYYREVSREDYLDMRWDQTRRYKSEVSSERELSEIESHCAKALSDRELVVPLRVQRRPVMLNPRTFEEDFVTDAKWGLIEDGKFTRYFLMIAKCVYKDDEPWWAVHFIKDDSDTSNTEMHTGRFFICDGWWGLLKMIADQVPESRV
jgi:hypothetical protein